MGNDKTTLYVKNLKNIKGSLNIKVNCLPLMLHSMQFNVKKIPLACVCVCVCVELDKLILKCTGNPKMQKAKNSENKKKEWGGWVRLAYVHLRFDKAVKIIKQTHGTECPETESTHKQKLEYVTDMWYTSVGKVVNFSKWYWSTGTQNRKKIKLYPMLTTDGNQFQENLKN